MISREAVFSIAAKELGDGLRNRWIWTVSAPIATSILAIAFFGAAPVGVAGSEGGRVVIASVMNLAVYLVPLLALLLGCGAVIDEKRRGTLDLILVYPISPGEYLSGAFLGMALALAIAIATGFGLSGIILALWFDTDMGAYLGLSGLAVVLGIVFLSLSFLVSILSRDRSRAVVVSVFVWICSVFVFDLLLLGLLVISGGKLPAELFSVLLLMNPTDVFRILCFKWLAGAASPLGLTDVMPFVPQPLLLGAALITWGALPLLISYGLFRHRVANDTLT